MVDSVGLAALKGVFQLIAVAAGVYLGWLLTGRSKRRELLRNVYAELAGNVHYAVAVERRLALNLASDKRHNRTPKYFTEAFKQLRDASGEMLKIRAKLLALEADDARRKELDRIVEGLKAVLTVEQLVAMDTEALFQAGGERAKEVQAEPSDGRLTRLAERVKRRDVLVAELDDLLRDLGSSNW